MAKSFSRESAGKAELLCTMEKTNTHHFPELSMIRNYLEIVKIPDSSVNGTARVLRWTFLTRVKIRAEHPTE